MASRLNPYIQFDGDARAAMEFYKGVFGGELSSNTFKEFGASHGPDDEDKLMHSQLETPSGFTLMAADTPQGMPYNPGENISISLSGQIKRCWTSVGTRETCCSIRRARSVTRIITVST